MAEPLNGDGEGMEVYKKTLRWRKDGEAQKSMLRESRWSRKSVRLFFFLLFTAQPSILLSCGPLLQSGNTRRDWEKPTLFSEPRDKRKTDHRQFEGGGKEEPCSGLQNGFL